MVASNPLFTKWTAKKFSATVLDDIWPEVTFFTLVATVVSVVSLKTNVDLGVNNQLLTVLGLVLGLVISFRTSSAYERYQEGGKMWTTIAVAAKNTAQMIWLHVPTTEREFKNESGITIKRMSALEVAIEKKTMINLIQAYAVSIKHLLRGEQGAYYRDLYPLIAFLPRYANEAPGRLEPQIDPSDRLPLWHLRNTTEFNRHPDPPSDCDVQNKISHVLEKTEATAVENGFGSDISVKSSPQESNGASTTSKRSKAKVFDPESVLPDVECEYVLKEARNPPQASIFDYIPLLRLFRWIGRGFRRRTAEERARSKKRKAYSEIVESHIPFEILLVLSNYSAYLMKNDFVKPAIASGLTNNIMLFTDTLTNLERICNTPLPFAYQVHLRMSLWIYLLLLPFQIYSSYKIITIPATTFASFLLLGFLEIGHEIENPFNYDLNDLDLDSFCLCIQRELAEITANPADENFAYIFTKLNGAPLAPGDERDAEELSKLKTYTIKGDNKTRPGSHSLHKTLVEGWRKVDQKTRDPSKEQ